MADGSHLPAEWRRSLAERGEGEPLAAVAAGFAEELRNAAHAAWGAAATRAWRGRERLPLVTQRALVLAPHDRFAATATEAARLLKGAPVADLPELGPGFLSSAPAVVGARVRRFLDG